MLKNLVILVLSVVLSFGVGAVSTKYCPFVKRHLPDAAAPCSVEKTGCCANKETPLPK